MRACGWSLALVGLGAMSGCGRFLFDPLTDAGSQPPLVIELVCETSATIDHPYGCAPTAPLPIADEILTWRAGPAHTCGWLAVESTHGAIGGTPSRSNIGACTGELEVTSSLRGTATTSWTVEVAPITVVQVDIGSSHTCALSSIGTIRCWGDNFAGQLGYNDNLAVSNGAAGRSIAEMGDVPVGGKVIQISLAYQETCALLDTGGVRCWGAGSFSRLGYEHVMDIGKGGPGGSIISNGDIPLGGKATKVAAGGNGGCALMASGGVRCWGLWHGHDNGNQLRGVAIVAAGDVPIGGGPIADLAYGYGHACALTMIGKVRCWGFAGALGYNDSVNVGTGIAGHSIMQMGDVPVGASVVHLSAGDDTTCGVLESGAVRCWGSNQYGQLGYNDVLAVGNGAVGRAITDLGDVPVGALVQRAWAGEEHICAVTRTNAVRCWGKNVEGQLGYNDTLQVGDGTAGRSIIDLGDVPVGGEVREVVTTDWDTGHTCVLMKSGAIRCWGNNASGQLGHGNVLNIGNGGAGGTILANGDVTPF